MPPEGTVKLNLTGQRLTSWVDIPETGATYTPPTTGEPIVGNEVLLWIGSTLYQAYNVELDFGLTVNPRLSQGGPNGHFGFVWVTSRPVLTATT